jgi:hypothetical protein
MARSGEDMKHKWRIKEDKLTNVVHETESTLKNENYESLLHYIYLIEISLENI